VRQGYVSAKAAKEQYGVVVDPVTFAVNEAATKRLRKGRAKAKRGKSGKRKPAKKS
jgi:N-methylhydantoinase B